MSELKHGGDGVMLVTLFHLTPGQNSTSYIAFDGPVSRHLCRYLLNCLEIASAHHNSNDRSPEMAITRAAFDFRMLRSGNIMSRNRHGHLQFPSTAAAGILEGQGPRRSLIIHHDFGNINRTIC